MRPLLAAGIGVLLLVGCGDDDSPAIESPDLGSSQAEEARSCLREAGFDVPGGRSSPKDRNAPDVELTMSIGGNQVFVAFYRDHRQAARAEAEVRRNAADFGGLVERRDSATIVWAKPPASDIRGTVGACALA